MTAPTTPSPWVWVVLTALAMVLAYGLMSAMASAQDDGASPGTGAAAPPAGDGALLYADSCARCHGDTGAADTRIGQRFNTRPFTAETLTALGADGIRAAIVEGRENMPAEDELTPEQIDSVVAHVQTLAP